MGSIWISDVSIEQVEQGFYNELNDSSLPLTLVALKGDQVIGAVSLYENDEIKPDLTPWLESLVVEKAYQNQGVGKLLLEKKHRGSEHIEGQGLKCELYTHEKIFRFPP